MPIEKIIELLEKQKPYFKNKGGLTVSGGEPLLQRQELVSLFATAQKAGFHTTLDTNGTILDEASKKLLNVTDLVLLDVKHIDPAWHQKVTGSTNKTVLQFAQYLEEIKKPTWLRYVLVPGYTDQEEFLHKWGESFKNYKTVERVEILPYHTFGDYKYEQMGLKNPLKNTNPPSKEMVDQAMKIFKKYFKLVYIR